MSVVIRYPFHGQEKRKEARMRQDNMKRLLVVIGLCIAGADPARAECLGDCGYGTQFAIIIAVGLAVVALIIFIMVKLGVGWLIKWIVAAGVLAVIVPPIVISAVHRHKRGVFEQLDFAGPLPRLAVRTPLVILGDLTYCPAPLERYIKAWAKEGVLATATWSVEGIDFTQPVSLVDLPMERHVGGQSTGSEPDYDGPYKGYSYHRRKLSPEDRKAAAAEIDYLVIAQCGGHHDLFEAFRDNPALQGSSEDFLVQLAMAPIEKGSGVLSVRKLEFDLLDLRYLGVTRGFLFANMRVGAENTVHYDEGALQTALCTKADGTTMSDCAR